MRIARFVCLLAVAIGAGIPASAEELVWATGKVNDSDGRPLTGALVAVYDESNKVVDYARTDQNGEYALAVPKRLLHIERRKGKGFVAEVFTGVTRVVGGAAGFVANPLRAGVHAVANAQADLNPNPLTKGGFAVGGAVVDSVLFAVSPHEKQRSPVEERKRPGSLLVKVIAPDHTDIVGVGHVYWMQQETFKAGGKTQKTLAAWMDPIGLQPNDSEAPSKIDNSYLKFVSARLEPSIAEPGQIVRITARLPLPPTPEINMVVVARNNRNGAKWQLKLDNDGYYVGEIQIDKRFPPDDQTISLLAYAADDQHPGRRPDAEAAIEREGLWNPAKPYIYDPLLVVSRTRADLLLTVVQPAHRNKTR